MKNSFWEGWNPKMQLKKGIPKMRPKNKPKNVAKIFLTNILAIFHIMILSRRDYNLLFYSTPPKLKAH